MARKAHQLPSGSWNIQVPISKEWDESRGKWKYKMGSLTAPTKAEVELLAAEWELSHNEIKRKSANPVLKEAISAYIEKNKGILSESTISAYITARDHGFPELMNMRIRSITEDIMNAAIKREYSRKKEKGGAVISPKTVKNEYGLIATVCREYNITWNVKLRSYKPPVHELSTPETLFKTFKGTDIELPVLLAMWMTLSMSEIRGLTKSGSIKGDLLYIDRVKIYAGGEDKIKPVAKNTTRNRGLTIPDYIKGLIDMVETDELVPLSSKVIEYKFRKIMEKANLPHMTFHDLRHVAVSTMEMLNIPDKYKQERGGWKTDSIMRSTYIQTFNPIRKAFDKMIDDYYEQIINASEKPE